MNRDEVRPHNSIQDPHAGQPVRTAGEPLTRARAALILVHGRGATAESILELGAEVAQPGLACLAPQAAGGAWYPNTFMAPLERNQPWLDSALRLVGKVVEQVEAAGIPTERTMLLGFSQGACLALEFAARNAKRYGGVAGLSGGLIGPDGLARNTTGTLVGTPVFLGCSDVDFHIPKARVDEAARTLTGLGGKVTKRLYAGMGHTVNLDEIELVRSMTAVLVGIRPPG